MKVTKTIDLEKQYSFPENLKVVHRNESILIISRETANWIVLQNEFQLDFFELLKKYKLKDADINNETKGKKKRLTDYVLS